MADAPYFARYASQGDSWRMALADSEGERVVVVFRRRDEAWQASGVVRVDTSGSRIGQIVDYSHCSWVIAAAAAAVTVAES